MTLPSPAPRVIGATVTYGARSASCLATLDALLAAGVSEIVVVDNGSVQAARRDLDAYAREHAPRVHVHRLDRNEGSARRSASPSPSPSRGGPTTCGCWTTTTSRWGMPL